MSELGLTTVVSGFTLGVLLFYILNCKDKRLKINNKLFKIDKTQKEIWLLVLGNRFLSSETITLELLSKLGMMQEELSHLENIVDENRETKLLLDRGIVYRLMIVDEMINTIINIDKESTNPDIYNTIIYIWYGLSKYLGMRLMPDGTVYSRV